jgi:hypothetical protein
VSSFFNSREVWVALIGALAAFVSAIIGAVIGGLLTGRYALRAQKQAAADQRQRDEEAERRAVEGTLRAIAAELTVLTKFSWTFPPAEMLLIAMRKNRGF